MKSKLHFKAATQHLTPAVVIIRGQSIILSFSFDSIRSQLAYIMVTYRPMGRVFFIFSYNAYEDCSKINRTEAVSFACFNIHVHVKFKLNNYKMYHKSEHVLHVPRKFQQISFKNNYFITNTNNKGSATRGRSSLHK